MRSSVLSFVRYTHTTTMAHTRVHPMSVTFLGTSSGGGPTENRNCSSLVCNLLPSGDLWMVDCAEGTTRQFLLQPEATPAKRIKMNQVNRLFVTHMHADHIMGIPTLLRNRLAPPRVNEETPTIYDISQRNPPKFEIYGPAGIRSFIRQNLKMTYTRSRDNYTVHELLTADDPITPCDPPTIDSNPNSQFDIQQWNVLHCSEVPGEDIRADKNGLWHSISSEAKFGCEVIVHAGPIHHRDPCIGYVFEEQTFPQRKIVVLGDTYDASPIETLCSNPCLLIHEATDSTISPNTDNNGQLSRRSHETVKEATLARGHSTPTMAGEFAKRIGAQKLVLNHIGGRFPAPRLKSKSWGYADRVIADLQNQATEAWGPPSGNEAIVALDFMNVLVPLPEQHSNLNSNSIQGTSSFPANAMYSHSPYTPSSHAYPGHQGGTMAEVEATSVNAMIYSNTNSNSQNRDRHRHRHRHRHHHHHHQRVNKREYDHHSRPQSNTSTNDHNYNHSNGSDSRERQRNNPRDKRPRQRDPESER